MELRASRPSGRVMVRKVFSLFVVATLSALVCDLGPLGAAITSTVDDPASDADASRDSDSVETDSSVDELVELAYEHLQAGRYDEARDAYETLLSDEQDAGLELDDRANLILNRFRVEYETGNLDAAAELLSTELEHERWDGATEAARIHVRLGRLAFERGDWDSARESVTTASRLNSEIPALHVLQGDLLTESGELDEALIEYRWCVRYYNRTQPTDAETLLGVADGSLVYARWKSVSSIFNFVVNTLCPDAIDDDPLSWQSYALSGNLLLEKYNKGQATTEFNRALAINARSADVLVGLGRVAYQEFDLKEAERYADRALAVNPRHLDALLLKADLALVSGDVKTAFLYADAAHARNAVDQRVLARRAAVILLEDGMNNEQALAQTFARVIRGLESPEPERDSENNPDSQESGDSNAEDDRHGDSVSDRFVELLDGLLARNPRPGVFLADLGEFLETQRKFVAAEHCYQAATVVMPQLSQPQTNLGLLAMRTGDLVQAREILDAAFKADPYHVRVSNMRKVIDVLDEQNVITTEHFIIRVAEQDQLLGEYMAEYLEQVHAELSEEFGFVPPERTPFEVFSDANGQSAHQWFSTRMTGLPWIQTIGASTGMIVALASPESTPQQYHWARVLKHEYVHILTLQQTGFNIPHWYTEALAVRAERNAMPANWAELIVERVPDGKLFDLTNVNLGFQRPEGPDDWHMAYCQSRLYAQYLEDEWGEESLSDLLAAYQQGLSTPDAIERVTGTSVEEFEQGYRKSLIALRQQMLDGSIEPELSVSDARKSFADDPEAADAAGRYALALLLRERDDQAFDVVDQYGGNLAADPWLAVAASRLAAADGDDELAQDLLISALDDDTPNAVLIHELASVAARRGEHEQAAEWFALGRAAFPYERGFVTGYRKSCQMAGRTEGVMEAYIDLANRDPEDVESRRRLMTLFFDAGDFKNAAVWGLEVLYVTIDDEEAHRTLADCYRELDDPASQTRELRALCGLDKNDLDSRAELAAVLLDQGDKEAAESYVIEVLARDPDHPEALRVERELRDRSR